MQANGFGVRSNENPDSLRVMLVSAISKQRPVKIVLHKDNIPRPNGVAFHLQKTVRNKRVSDNVVSRGEEGDQLIKLLYRHLVAVVPDHQHHGDVQLPEEAPGCCVCEYLRRFDRLTNPDDDPSSAHVRHKIVDENRVEAAQAVGQFSTSIFVGARLVRVA